MIPTHHCFQKQNSLFLQCNGQSLISLSSVNDGICKHSKPTSNPFVFIIADLVCFPSPHHPCEAPGERADSISMGEDWNLARQQPPYRDTSRGDACLSVTLSHYNKITEYFSFLFSSTSHYTTQFHITTDTNGRKICRTIQHQRNYNTILTDQIAQRESQGKRAS